MRRMVCFCLIFITVLCIVGCDAGKNKEKSNNDNYEFIDDVEQYPDYQAFVGEFEDRVSQRATATVTESEDQKSVQIIVKWANSAFSGSIWIMTATFKDEKLSYKDCRYFETENDIRDLIYENGKGYFTVDEDMNLYWVGAEDENCRECIFERVPEVNENE